MTLTASNTCLRILASTPYLTSHSLREIISTFGTEAMIADSLQAATNEGEAILIITNTPVYVLAAYLQSAPDMRTALAQWTEWAEDLLHIQRQNRRNITLVDLEMLARGNVEDVDRLKSRLDIAFSKLPVSIAAPRPENALLLLATVGLSADHRTASLAEELEAAMFRQMDETSAVDLAERVLADLRQKNEELSLQREAMALQVSEIERQARFLIAEEQKTLRATEALSQENALVLQLRNQLHEQSTLEPMLAAAQNRIEVLSTSKQRYLVEFSQLLAKIFQKRALMRWPWVSRRAWQIRIVRDCGVVDPDWYLQQHQDVATAGAEPFRHYIDYGVKEGRPPNANFL